MGRCACREEGGRVTSQNNPLRDEAHGHSLTSASVWSAVFLALSVALGVFIGCNLSIHAL